MKNLHLLPTDKASRLFLKENTLLLNNQYTLQEVFPKGKCQNIYITSTEEVNKTDYVIVSCSEADIEEVNLVTEYYNEQFLFDDRTQIHMDYCRKIILTTDQDLIKNGVQAIDDEFLEWFVKNPSCEEVETERVVVYDDNNYGSGEIFHSNRKMEYKIIIPKEEPKQETISKKLLYVQDYKSQIKALQYVIDFYEILTKKEIVEKRDNLFKELKKLENE